MSCLRELTSVAGCAGLQGQLARGVSAPLPGALASSPGHKLDHKDHKLDGVRRGVASLEAAAVRIQAAHRGRCARKTCRNRREMQTAVWIQAVFRGHRCRKEQDEEAEDDDAAELTRTVSRRRRKAGRGRVTRFKRSETKRGTCSRSAQAQSWVSLPMPGSCASALSISSTQSRRCGLSLCSPPQI